MIKYNVNTIEHVITIENKTMYINTYMYRLVKVSIIH